MPLTARPIDERLWESVDACGVCWEWNGSKQAGGYGQISRGHTETLLVHRLSWEILVGPIPDGLQLDHLCRNKTCVNPDHLEPVTFQENLRRGAPINAELLRRRTHCVHGHPLSGDNIRIRSNRGKRERVCKECARRRGRVYARRRRATTE